MTKVEVPNSWPTTQEEFLDSTTNIENPKECDTWRTIDDPKEMEFYIQMRNRLHFGQAQGTPFTTDSLRNDIDWSATSPEAENVLNGGYRLDPMEYHMHDDEDMDIPQHELLQAFLESCRRSPAQQATPPSTPEISLEELRGRIKCWNERTTTSPSGLHLGHLKSLTARTPSPPNDDDNDDTRGAASTGVITRSTVSIQTQLLGAQLSLINYGLRHGFAFRRWKNVVNVMIVAKEPGNHKIHRLRVIHLYESDLGAAFTILWKKMFADAENRHAINDGQYGGRKGHEAAYLPYAEELKYDICCLSRKSLVNSQLPVLLEGSTGSLRKSHRCMRLCFNQPYFRSKHRWVCRQPPILTRRNFPSSGRAKAAPTPLSYGPSSARNSLTFTTVKHVEQPSALLTCLSALTNRPLDL